MGKIEDILLYCIQVLAILPSVKIYRYYISILLYIMSSIESKIEIDTNSEKKSNSCPMADPKEAMDHQMEIPFWSEDPNVLFRSFEFFPTENMNYSQKMNAISRLIILLAIVGYLFSQNIRLLFVAVLILLGIYLVYSMHRTDKKHKKRVFSENFDEEIPEKLVKDVYAEIDSTVPKPREVFDVPTPTNPMSNVLMSDYDYNPHKKPAPPSFNENVGANILSQAKQMVIDANPGQPNIADKLFRNLGDEFIFEQSMRPFVSNPSTTIPNDQQAFADFCYGSMISSKEGNMFSLARNLARHQT